MSETKNVNICAVPYTMSIIDGGVMFSDKTGFYGVTGRFVFEYRCGLWYLATAHDTFDAIAACHVRRMHELLAEHVLRDHEDDNPKHFAFRETQSA